MPLMLPRGLYCTSPCNYHFCSLWSHLHRCVAQDINTSLYFITVDRKNRSMRRLGQRVPRYSKVLQVRLSGMCRSADYHSRSVCKLWQRSNRQLPSSIASLPCRTPLCNAAALERTVRAADLSLIITRARQGAVLFVALLVLLWVPLLIFSSSANPPDPGLLHKTKCECVASASLT